VIRCLTQHEVAKHAAKMLVVSAPITGLVRKVGMKPN
jgi:hypothetical protein